MNANVLIEASAGTGKTQALAERLIELLRGGVKPQEIVALTFSRAAAGEIFERFVTLLAERIEKGEADAALLREVIATQHLSQIGTLDSFLMRIVRSFPLELGLRGELRMMDEYETDAERARVSFGILRRTDAAAKRAFGEAFALAMNRENVRSFVETYRTFIAGWHERYLSMGQGPADFRSRISALGLPVSDFESSVSGLKSSADALEGIVDSDAWREFVLWVRTFRGMFSGLKGFAKKFVEEGDGVFAGSTVEIDFNRRHYAFGGEQAAAIRAAMSSVYGYVLRQKVEMAYGIWTLLDSFETEYAKKVRNAGRLTFADVPRLILALPDDARLALEYRMDAKIRAWALDEFQDTSREQWAALGGLVEEAKQSGGEKSVFVVGDRKQAIYGWRNGDVGIFTRERESGAYAVGELRKSWRYGTPIAEAINAVFVRGRLADEFPGWEAPEHETAKPELGGFVQAVESLGPKPEDFVVPVRNALQAVDPVGRGISAAVLVRTNAMGRTLAAALKEAGVSGVVWEGESAILDTPALLGFLDTLRLADHPGDGQAYEHFRRTPLARAKYGEEVPPASELSSEFALSFATRGIVRTFRALRATLPEDPKAAWSEFTEGRFTDLLRAAAEFERTMAAGVRLGDFIAFLKSRETRNVAEPGKIKVLTIHRSKGLGFDYVVLPLYEPKSLDREPEGPLVGDGWILPDPGAKVTRAVKALQSAAELRRTRSEQEELCAYYVAMTRAKRAMTVVLHPEPEKATGRRFSQFVREAIPAPIGKPDWYREFSGLSSSVSGLKSSPAPGEDLRLETRDKRRIVKRRLPSLKFQTGESAGSLFAAAGARQEALARGVGAHAEYERVEWVDAGKATSDLARALVKPAELTALWRERSFEVWAEGEWTSGRFDRVVFTGTGAARRATVYDFKTNRRLRGEGEADFARRMRETYAGQMSAYRRALVALTGLEPSAVSCVLLLTETQQAVLCYTTEKHKGGNL